MKKMLVVLSIPALSTALYRAQGVDWNITLIVQIFASVIYR